MSFRPERKGRGAAPKSRGALAGGQAVIRWRLAPLLALRLRAEERARGDLERALAAVQRAEEQAALLRAALGERRGEPAGAARAAEVARASQFLARLGQALASALEKIEQARAGAEEARGAHARARLQREWLEREHERWRVARRRRLEAAVERELDDRVSPPSRLP